jgi:hypothetical protein
MSTPESSPGDNTALMSTSLVLAAWRGQEARALELIEASIQDATAEGEGRAISLIEIYPDAGHGFLFQYPAEFAADVDEFLA